MKGSKQAGAPRKAYRKFTKEFKEAAVRRIEEGTPLKQVARAHNIDPAVVRAWRDEVRDLGPLAFLRTGGRRFTKEIKQAAVKRVEEGTPAKEVARAYRVDPTELRRWRTAWLTLGPEAFDGIKKPRPKAKPKPMPRAEPKPRLVTFRLKRGRAQPIEGDGNSGGRIELNGLRSMPAVGWHFSAISVPFSVAVFTSSGRMVQPRASPAYPSADRVRPPRRDQWRPPHSHSGSR
jgi:transposase-like protein